MVPRALTRVAILAAAFSFPLLAGAQSFTSADPFSIAVSPHYPAPYGSATLSFTSSNLDLTRAKLAITVAGKEIYSGNAGPVSITVGAPGKTVTARVVATVDGKSYAQTVSLTPEDVGIVAEPLSSAPPLYAGKPLTPEGGQVRVVAIANLYTASGKQLDPSTLSYTWSVNGTTLAGSSGIGKDAIIAASPLQYRDGSVSVVVQSPDGSISGGATLTLTPQQPTLRLYENDPLRGIRFDRALSGDYNIAASEVSLYAALFSSPTTDGVPGVSWFLNGSAAQTGPTITLRPTGSGQGKASLSASVSSGGFSTTAQSLSLTFGASSSSNLFGL